MRFNEVQLHHTFLTNYDVICRKLLNILHCTKMNKLRKENSNGDYLSSAMSVVPKHCYRNHKCSPNMKCINILGLRVVLFVQLPKSTLNLLVGAPQTL